MVIVLSGPSSSGKSTLARAVQRRLWQHGRLFLHVDADALLPGLPDIDAGDPGLDGLLDSLTAAAEAFAAGGFDIIVDGLLPYADPDGRVRVLAALGRHELRYVGVFCDPAELDHREAMRSDRRELGWAATQALDLHDGQDYDLAIDTTGRDVGELADELITGLDLLSAPPEP